MEWIKTELIGVMESGFCLSQFSKFPASMLRPKQKFNLLIKLRCKLASWFNMQICSLLSRTHNFINPIQCRRALSQSAKTFRFYHFILLFSMHSTVKLCGRANTTLPNEIHFALFIFVVMDHGVVANHIGTTSNFSMLLTRESAYIFFIEY